MVGFNKITRSAEVLIRCERTPCTTTACSVAPVAVEVKLAAAAEAAPAPSVETAPAAAADHSLPAAVRSSAINSWCCTRQRCCRGHAGCHASELESISPVHVIVTEARLA